MSLLIPTHALPPMSYRVPDHLLARVRAGSAVVVPLSGYSRLGIVIETGESGGERALEDIRKVDDSLSLSPEIVELCRWISGTTAAPLPVVLRAALPPGLDTTRYRVIKPAPGWPWRAGTLVARTLLRRSLGGEGLKEAEAAGRVEFSPGLPHPKAAEWAVALEAEPDLRRAPRQRELLAAIRAAGNGGSRVTDLLEATGAARETLLRLEHRGAVRIERRREEFPALAASGLPAKTSARHYQEIRRVLSDGSAWLWRLPTADHPDAAAELARAAIARREQALILAPEIGAVEGLVSYLRSMLPSGSTVAAYHSGLGRERAAVYEAFRAGKVDALVGTRAAALVQMRRPGAVCVVDEPNEAYRSEPGYEGLPIHVRDIVLRRADIERIGALMLSPAPSLRLYGSSEAKGLPARPPSRWPAVRIVDMRGSGASLSSTLLDACRRVLGGGGRAGVISNRLGYATVVSCSRCGSVHCCPECDLPLALHAGSAGGAGTLFCRRCGYATEAGGACKQCGSERRVWSGIAAERLREDLSRILQEPVGFLTAGARDREDAPVIVGTAPYILGKEWDLVAVPDADALLLGSGMGAVERGFRVLYRAAESARELLLVQTRSPEHYALQAAARGDYRSFAAAELPRLRALGYPPYAHLAALRIEGPEDAVRRAVESRLRPAVPPGVVMSQPVPVPGERLVWRVLLRSSGRSAVARAANEAARMAAETRGRDRLRVLVEVDPEEV